MAIEKKLIKIGTPGKRCSTALIIPKDLLAALEYPEKVRITLKGETLIIAPIREG